MPEKLKTWIAFCCLCILGASRWLVPDLGSPVSAQPLVLVVGAFLAASFAWARVAFEGRPQPGGLLRGACGGALLLLGLELPHLITQGTRGSDETIALALCPIVIAVATSALKREASVELTGQLWPGLAAVTGLLLLLPEPSVRNVAGGVAFLGAPLLAGVGAVLICREEGGSAGLRAAALSGVLLIACLGWLFEGGMQPWRLPSSTWTAALACGTEAVSLLLSFTVLLSVGARRWSAVFAVVPLLLALQGVLLLRPQVGVRPFSGMGLLLLASVFLLLPSDSEEQERARFLG